MGQYRYRSEPERYLEQGTKANSRRLLPVPNKMKNAAIVKIYTNVLKIQWRKQNFRNLASEDVDQLTEIVTDEAARSLRFRYRPLL